MRVKVSSLLAALLFLALLSGLGAPVVRAQVPDAKPRGYVNDYAGVLSPAAKQRLEALATELDQKAGAQLAIVTVNSLGGEPIEDFSVDLATRWGIGRKEKGDTGVLLLLAIQDRQNRMEVGYGIEPIIPDGRAGSILRDMRPLLRAGDYDGALLQAAGQIAGIIAQDANVTLSGSVPQSAPQPPRQRRGLPLGLLWLFLFFGLPLLMRPRRRRTGWHGPGVGTGLVMGGLLGAMLGGGTRGGGLGGGGGFSSGGFGGFGGGGFGGGGASSSW